MKRRLNFTGRLRITHSDLNIRLTEVADPPLTFTAERDLRRYDLPSNAQVYLEAFLGPSYMRFDWGSVAEPRSLSSGCELTEIDSRDSVRFRVKVVGTGPTTNGILLAQADHIRVDASEQSILPVRDTDLTYVVWKLDFEDNEPQLLVNSRIDGIKEIVRYDPTFAALVFPAVLKEILENVIDEWSGESDDEQPWVTNWMTFASSLTNETPPARDDVEQRQRWIDDSVRAFAKKNRLLNRYRDVLNASS